MGSPRHTKEEEVDVLVGHHGPDVTNQIIKEALHPYPDGLHIVTKVGARRDAQGGVSAAMAPDELRQAVQDNLDHLGPTRWTS